MTWRDGPNRTGNKLRRINGRGECLIRGEAGRARPADIVARFSAPRLYEIECSLPRSTLRPIRCTSEPVTRKLEIDAAAQIMAQEARAQVPNDPAAIPLLQLYRLGASHLRSEFEEWQLPMARPLNLQRTPT